MKQTKDALKWNRCYGVISLEMQTLEILIP